MFKSSPEVIDLTLMLIDALLLVWMCQHQALCSIIQVLHLLSDRCKVSLQAVVFTLQTLNGSKIMTEIC